MGKKSSPDYEGAAEKQAEASREITEQQTWANRPDQITPWGTVEWQNQSVWDPSTEQNINKWTQKESLTPELQRALDAQTALQTGRSEIGAGMLGRAAGEFGSEMDWGQFGDVGGLDYNPTEMRAAAEDAAYGRQAMRLDDQFRGKEQQLDIKLRNQGLRPGDQAYDAQIQNLAQQSNDAYERARLGATAEGRAESGQMYGQQMGASQYENQLRQQQIKEAMTKRGFSLNEINALISGQQVANPQFESFKGATKSETPQYGAAALNQGNFDQAQSQAFMSGLGDLAGAGTTAYSAGMFSDRRLKTHVRQVGKWLGYPFYLYRYVWGQWSVGVMSDEIPEKYVNQVEGFDTVDYARLEADHG
jgi:hypothetical protein